MLGQQDQTTIAPSRRRAWIGALVVFALVCGAASLAFLSDAASAQAQAQRPPYWASINRNEAIMRRGPSSEIRAMWLYRRMDLPLKVLAVRDDWRQVEDPGGVRGWMHRRLLSSRRTAIVVDDVAAMHVSPDADTAVAYRAEPGVVGRISDCGNGWCLFDVRGRSGYVRGEAIWGDEPL